VFVDSLGHPPSLFWDIGDLDSDSLLDLLNQRWDSAGVGKIGFQIYEPNDYWSFPKKPVWSWRYEWLGNSSTRMYITDLDRDGLKEILTADADVAYVFENRGDNQYTKVYSDTLPFYYSTPAFAIGDFDGDGLMEFVRGTTWGGSSRPTVYVYECTGDDQYQIVWMDTLDTPNMIDLIALPDLDGDGKLEFIIGDFHRSSTAHTGRLWI
jgi:hypothetical protein